MEKHGDNSLLEKKKRKEIENICSPKKKHIRLYDNAAYLCESLCFPMLTILSSVVVLLNIFMFERFILAKPL